MSWGTHSPPPGLPLHIDALCVWADDRTHQRKKAASSTSDSESFCAQRGGLTLSLQLNIFPLNQL